METIDWSKAPEGATHYLKEPDAPRREYWVKVEKDGLGFCRFGFEPDGFRPWAVDYERFLAFMIPRPPTQPAWSGEGLPPAGCKVEYLTYGNEWKGGTYVGQFNGQMVCGCDDSGVVGVVGSGQLRPIRTPEQIAAEEREAAVAMACADISQAMQAMTGCVITDSAVKVIRAMIDEGYRKTEGN
jgi:hypothetical protein